MNLTPEQKKKIIIGIVILTLVICMSLSLKYLVIDKMQESKAQPTIDNRDYINERYEIVPKNNNSIFCTCGSLINKNCTSPESRVNNYNSGLTEFSNFKPHDWENIMPYDKFISKPDYEKRNSGWVDEMPYDIYNS